MKTQLHQFARRLPVGAEYQPGAGVSFRIWAPNRRTVKVIIDDFPPIDLQSQDGGYFHGVCESAKPGTRYRFKVDEDNHLYPDPVSRHQPDGVHGPSQVVDPTSYQWSDSNWRGINAKGQVLYEMHIGTFTEAGTWKGAIEKLPELKSLGITCLEVMPVAEFPGRFGWGYDGVALFAPAKLYGDPDDFRHFVNQAHTLGLAVILDVVYNHLGPDGNYLKTFSDHYFTNKHCNDWGESLNFDDTGAEGVRTYFVSNARHWISEYHLDGFRFDATQAILDDSPRHILAEICEAARKEAGNRGIYLICENEPQHSQIARSVDRGGYGFDALWNDDFHHSAMVALTGRNEAYRTDYLGSPQELISACKWGYLFQGQFSAWQMKHRGTSARDLPASAFVNYIQNHDQVANFGHGERVHQLCGLAQFKAMTVLLLLAPQTPLIFQGQEFAASSPFLYFADHTPELSDLVRKGRLKEMSQFPSNGHPEMRPFFCDPSDEETFKRCKLDWSRRDKGWHARIYQFHKELLQLRQDDPVFGRWEDRTLFDGAVIGPNAFALRFGNPDGDRLVLINLGSDLHLRSVPEPLLAPPAGMRWEIMLSTESPRFGGSGIAPMDALGRDWRLPGINFELPGRCALVLKPVPLTAADLSEYARLAKDREDQRKEGLNQL